MRVFDDEDVYKELKRRLTESGHDVVSPADLGMRGVGDEVCFLYAATDSRVIVTHNAADFATLHAAWLTWAGHWRIGLQPLHAGVLAVPHRDRLRAEEAADHIQSMLRDPNALINAFYRLDRSGRWRSYA